MRDLTTRETGRMVIVVNLGPTAPTHSQLNDLAQSCGCDDWHHIMVPQIRPEPVEQFADQIAAIARQAVIESGVVAE